jgi:uncharacterized protein YggE
MKQTALALFLVAINVSVAVSQVYPRLIKVEGTNEISVEADEITLTYTISNEDDNRVKLPIEKIEAQLRQTFTNKNIALTKLTMLDAGFATCNATSKTFVFTALSPAEYNVVSPYLRSHQFVRDIIMGNQTISNAAIEKYTDQLINGAILNGKNKAELIAKNINEKIDGLQNVTINYVGADKIAQENAYYDYDNEEYSANKIKTIKLTYRLSLDYVLVSSTPNMYPKFITVKGMGEKEFKKPEATFDLTLSLTEYEGEGKIAFAKLKKELENYLVTKGVSTDEINKKENKSENEEFYAQLSYAVKGENNVKEVLDYLSNNKNVSSLKLNSDKSPVDFSKIENDPELLKLAIDDAKKNIVFIEKYLHLKTDRVYEVNDFSTTVKPLVGAINYYTPDTNKPIKLSETYLKQVQVSYEFK